MTSPAMDNYDTISALTLDIRDFDGPPSLALNLCKPTKYLRKAWIPQTICDCIWVLYEFETKEERENWEASLNDQFKSCLTRNIIRSALEFGWGNKRF